MESPRALLTKTAARRPETYCKLLQLSDEDFDRYDRILDVGSGLSTFTGVCLDKGKEAYAIDGGYSDIGMLTSHYINGEIPVSASEIRRRYRQTVAGCSSIEEMREAIERHRRERVAAFKDILEKSKGHFLSGDFSDLPFKDRSFDLAVSVELFGAYGFYQPAEIRKGILEMARVAREVRVYSFMLRPDSFDLPLLRQSLNGSRIDTVTDTLITLVN